MHGNQWTLTTSTFERDMLTKKCAKNELDQNHNIKSQQNQALMSVTKNVKLQKKRNY